MGSAGSRRCVFCGGEGLTREHVWPNWISGVLPKGIELEVSKTQTDPKTELTKPLGSPWRSVRFDLTVRRVCGACNGGWMSRLEEAAKPLLVPLILGESALLDAEERRVIAAWALLRVVMAEYIDPTQIAVPAAHRRWLFKEKKPPRHGVYIWMAGYEGEDSAGFYRHVPLASHLDSSYRSEQVNSYGVTFGIYKLVFQVFGATTAPRAGGDLRQGGDLAERTVRLWPETRDVVYLPPERRLSKADLDYFANVFVRPTR
jgi:hypothetical protein